MNVDARSLPIFRSIRPEDHTIVSGMIKSLYRELGLADDYITDKKISDTFDQLRIQPTHLALDVFELDGAVVGYSLIFRFWYNEFGGMVLNIDELFVEPEFRSIGITTQYLTQLAEKKGRDYVALSLEVLPENKGAYSLYKRSGFVEKETVTLYKLL